MRDRSHEDLTPESLVDRGPHRPSKEQVILGFAHLVALRGVCDRLRVGAVVTSLDLTQVYGYGYNGPERGGPNRCQHPNRPGNCGCVHAEENALLKVRAPWGAPLALFTTHSPCKACARLIVNAPGIELVVYAEEFRTLDGVVLLRSRGIQTRKLPPWFKL